ncbi:MAG: hypothetical protein H0M93_00975 [Methanophagales archaeon]|nr:hypothetical protein [Methanophagales archaeon]
MKTMVSWYGWIPILSGKLTLTEEKDINEKAKRLQKEIDVCEEYTIEYEYEGTGKWKIVLKTKAGNLEVDCEVEESGLCKITHVGGVASYDKIVAIYRFIRDIYHMHIHHSGDLQLRPIEINGRDAGIEKILDQYRQKVTYYPQEVKDHIDNRRYDDAIDSILAGRGEMQYAKSFTNLFFDDDPRDSLNRTFESADKSLEVLMQKVTVPTSNEKRFPLALMSLIVFLSAFHILTLHFGLWLGSVGIIAVLIVIARGVVRVVGVVRSLIEKKRIEEIKKEIMDADDKNQHG